MKRVRRTIQFVFFLALTIVVTLSLQFAYSAEKERYSKLQIFSKVLNLVQQYYVENVNTEKLVYGAIKGMLAELDPHTNFLPPELFKDFRRETTGEFPGIGVEITIQDAVLTIISPVEDGPAWKAGVKAGDRIITVEGESTKGMSLAEAAQKMRGPVGSNVRMGVFREGVDEPIDFTVKRQKIKVRSVKKTDMDDGYVYVKLTSFIEKSSQDFKSALSQHKKKYGEVKGLIIDLRNNPGGLLAQAVKISDMFLAGGKIVSTIGRNESKKEVTYASKANSFSNFPIIILINEYSASASEILAGALQDNKRAVVMGQRSFGKGSVQSVVELEDGSGLKLTVARYFTPNGRSIQAMGIKPDILVENVDSKSFKNAIIKKKVRREKDIKGHLRGKNEKKTKGFWARREKGKKRVRLSPKEALLQTDFQIAQAYNHLKAWNIFPSLETSKKAK